MFVGSGLLRCVSASFAMFAGAFWFLLLKHILGNHILATFHHIKLSLHMEQHYQILYSLEPDVKGL